MRERLVIHGLWETAVISATGLRYLFGSFLFWKFLLGVCGPSLSLEVRAAACSSFFRIKGRRREDVVINGEEPDRQVDHLAEEA